MRQLYAAIYRAFRHRRSLLLLNLEKQVQIDELPWVAAINRFRSESLRAVLCGWREYLSRHDRHDRCPRRRRDIARARQAEAEAQYQQTIADFLQVLDAERTLLEAQDQLAQGRTDATTALVAVYRALGGSWEFPGVEP